MADIPATHYAHNGEVSIAYQTVGEGPFDMMFLPGWISHVEHVWELPALRRFLERLSGFSRLILFDRRGAGLSERISTAPTLQEEVADAIAVLDAAGSERAALLSYALGGPTAIVLARQHPERVGALVLYAAVARTLWAADYNWAPSREWREAIVDQIVEGWGEGRRLAEFAPSAHQDPSFASWFARMERLAASPGVARTMSLAAADIDVRGELEHIRVPTIVMHRPQERVWDVRHSQYLAENIPGARFLPLPGVDSFPWLGDEGLLNEVEEFLTGGRSSGERERTLLTVLFTDIVGATARAAELGDARWRDELAAHDEAIRRVLRRFDGHEVKTIGDSFLATFAGAPSRALRCAQAIIEATAEIGVTVRIGVHTGECELIGDDVGGMAVHIAARIAALAGPSEVLVSGTAYGTVFGSGLEFRELGMQELRGVSSRWPIFALC